MPVVCKHFRGFSVPFFQEDELNPVLKFYTYKVTLIQQECASNRQFSTPVNPSIKFKLKIYFSLTKKLICFKVFVFSMQNWLFQQEKKKKKLKFLSKSKIWKLNQHCLAFWVGDLQ